MLVPTAFLELPLAASEYQGGGTRAKPSEAKVDTMTTVLWLIAVVLVVMGIVALVRRQILPGILLIVVGLLVGPGGVSIFNR